MRNALAFMSGDLGAVWGLVTLFLALLGVGCVQAGIAMAVMFGMNKLIPDKLTETTYGDFDFDNFQKPAFHVFLARMVVIFVGTTVVLHLLEYLVVYRDIIRHWGLVTFALFLLETAGIAAGLHYVFRLDKLRLSIITAASALVYLLFFALLRWSNLLI